MFRCGLYTDIECFVTKILCAFFCSPRPVYSSCWLTVIHTLTFFILDMICKHMIRIWTQCSHCGPTFCITCTDCRTGWFICALICNRVGCWCSFDEGMMYWSVASNCDGNYISCKVKLKMEIEFWWNSLLKTHFAYLTKLERSFGPGCAVIYTASF
jgi:hypothetical protein